ncbi:MAG: beta-ketoacyl-ACP synthase II [Anaerolineae bacterium]|nr:beta-ketoacyl-ACP synthase II [Anaerolineae bacterium]
MSKESDRVVITGMGTINPLGLDVETTWRKLLAGKSGAGPLTHFDPSAFLTQIACEVKDFKPEDYMSRKDARRLDQYIQFAIASTAQALEQAGLTIDERNADDVGVIIGSGIGGLPTMDKGYHDLFTKGPMRVSPLTGPMMIANMAAGQVAITFGAAGPNFCIVSACATGSNVLGEAAELIRRGDAVAVIAGGSEAPFVPFGMAAFHRTGALSRRNNEPERASRPFDAQRDGFVFGEGAGILILESLEYAQKRGAEPLAEIVGYGATADAYHISAPAEDGRGAAKAMERALKKAGLAPTDVDYINAHGTSTILNDVTETRAIKTVFGDYAYQVPISSTKSMTGHLMGAAGALEAIVCVKTIQEGIIHPTINYEYPDPECDLDYVPNVARPADVRVALSNSFGFGGHNATIVLKAYEP